MKKNIFTYFDYLNITSEIIKNVYVNINKNFIEKHLSQYSYEYIVENINSEEIVTQILPYIEKQHGEYVKMLKEKYADCNYNFNDNIYSCIFEFKIKNINIILYDNMSHSDEDISIKFNLKYNISSKFLAHDIEIFTISNNDFMNSVSKFHLPCVRAFYDGKCLYDTIIYIFTNDNDEYALHIFFIKNDTYGYY